jgi:hypothetical protein
MLKTVLPNKDVKILLDGYDCDISFFSHIRIKIVFEDDIYKNDNGNWADRLLRKRDKMYKVDSYFKYVVLLLCGDQQVEKEGMLDLDFDEYPGFKRFYRQLRKAARGLENYPYGRIDWNNEQFLLEISEGDIFVWIDGIWKDDGSEYKYSVRGKLNPGLILTDFADSNDYIG